MKQVRDVGEFSNLFKVNIPYSPEFNYYIDTLSQSKEYKDIRKLVNDFCDFEDWVSSQGYSSVFKYKMKCLDLIKDYVSGTLAYQEFTNFDYSFHKFRKQDDLKSWIKKQSESDSPDYLMSYDLSSANFNTIKSFGNDIESTWEIVCKKLHVHHMLISSKSFRQVVFGNLNPKRNGKIQLMRMNGLADHLERGGHKDKVVSITNDEICLSLPSDMCDEVGFEQAIQNLFEIKDCLSVPTKKTVFAVKKIGKEMFKKVVLYQEGLKKEDRYTTLSGVPGNKFYKTFKKEVLNKDVEERDLYFQINGEMAKWINK